MTAPDRDEIRRWLTETDPGALEELWQAADQLRRNTVGDHVWLRGLVEVSNICHRHCTYCGIHAGNAGIRRYRMRPDEILSAARLAREYGYDTVVLQAGEDPAINGPWLAEIIRGIKEQTGLAVTLSMGEQRRDVLEQWLEAGADRYLLRFETSDPSLYRRIHPPGALGCVDRIEMLKELRQIGYQIGSGIMVGLPGQSYDTLLNDLLTFAELELDMVGIGPWISTPGTALALQAEQNSDMAGQVQPSQQMSCIMVALTRLLLPGANIPSTTALATIAGDGRRHGLCRGANVIMPNVTPRHYRENYQIYPNKAASDQSPSQTRDIARRELEVLERPSARQAGIV